MRKSAAVAQKPFTHYKQQYNTAHSSNITLTEHMYKKNKEETRKQLAEDCRAPPKSRLTLSHCLPLTGTRSQPCSKQRLHKSYRSTLGSYAPLYLCVKPSRIQLRKRQVASSTTRKGLPYSKHQTEGQQREPFLTEEITPTHGGVTSHKKPRTDSQKNVRTYLHILKACSSIGRSTNATSRKGVVPL